MNEFRKIKFRESPVNGWFSPVFFLGVMSAIFRTIRQKPMNWLNSPIQGLYAKYINVRIDQRTGHFNITIDDPGNQHGCRLFDARDIQTLYPELKEEYSPIDPQEIKERVYGAVLLQELQTTPNSELKDIGHSAERAYESVDKYLTTNAKLEEFPKEHHELIKKMGMRYGKWIVSINQSSSQ